VLTQNFGYDVNQIRQLHYDKVGWRTRTIARNPPHD